MSDSSTLWTDAIRSKGKEENAMNSTSMHRAILDFQINHMYLSRVNYTAQRKKN